MLFHVHSASLNQNCYFFFFFFNQYLLFSFTFEMNSQAILLNSYPLLNCCWVVWNTSLLRQHFVKVWFLAAKLKEVEKGHNTWSWWVSGNCLQCSVRLKLGSYLNFARWQALLIAVGHVVKRRPLSKVKNDGKNRAYKNLNIQTYIGPHFIYLCHWR